MKKQELRIDQVEARKVSNTKKLELTLKERIILPNLFPAEGNKIEQIIIRSMIKGFEFTEEEKKEYDLKFHQEGVTWNPKLDEKTFAYEVDESQVTILKQVSDSTDKAKKVNQHNLSLIEKIDAL